jgi:hypothetical protein
MASASRATIPTLLLALAGPPLLVFASRRVFGPAPPVTTELWLHLLFCAIPVSVILVVRYSASHWRPTCRSAC